MANVFAFSGIPLIAILFVFLTAGSWFYLITVNVPEPYLVSLIMSQNLEQASSRWQDEVFHVGQAQAYLRGRWDIWDPKLTTPPGLWVELN